MKRFLLPALACSLFSCAPAVSPVQGAQGVSCISLASVAGRRVVGADTLLFETAGPNDYRNRLASHCPATQRIGTSASVALLDVQGSQLCAGDRVRIFDPLEDRVAAAPTCRLGNFEPVPR